MKNKGITLVALVISIIILLIITGVSIGILAGENGLISRTIKAKESQKVAEITDNLELVKPMIALENHRTGTNIDEYLEYIQSPDKINYSISGIERESEDNCYITVDGDYVFLLEHEENGNIKIIYQGKAGKLLPQIKSLETDSTTNSITVYVTAKRQTNYKYYIKENENGDYQYSGEDTSGTYCYNGLIEDKIYYIKVEAINQNGSDYKEEAIYTGEFSDEIVEIGNQEWDDSTQKAAVTISTNETDYIIQYTTTPENDSSWTRIENGAKTPYMFTAGTTIFARLYDGTNESKQYGSFLIEKTEGNVTLGENSGSTTYPENKTTSVTGTGELQVSSDNTNIATATISNGILTITPGTVLGTTTIKVKSLENYRYEEAEATYTITVGGATLSYTAAGYNKNYDAVAHGITVSCSGATIKYGTEAGVYNKDTSPTRTDVGTTTVYYQITKPGYNTVTGSADITITKSVARIGSNYYTTLANAISAISSSGTIVMIDNTSESVTIPSGRTITINTNGKTITGSLTNNGTLTLNGTGKLYHTGTTLTNNGNLTLAGATIQSQNSSATGVCVANHGTFSMSSGTITSNCYSLYAYSDSTNTSSTGGTITSSSTSGYALAIYSKKTEVCQFKDSTISNSASKGVIFTASDCRAAFVKCSLTGTISANAMQVVAASSTTCIVYAWQKIDSYTAMLFPTWTAANGQDDIRWDEVTSYSTRNGSRCWTYTVKRSDHGNQAGEYCIHVYTASGGATKNYVSATSYFF